MCRSVNQSILFRQIHCCNDIAIVSTLVHLRLAFFDAIFVFLFLSFVMFLIASFHRLIPTEFARAKLATEIREAESADQSEETSTQSADLAELLNGVYWRRV